MSHGESFLVKASNVCKPAITFDLEQYFSPWSGTANITQEFNGYWSNDQMHILNIYWSIDQMSSLSSKFDRMS
ncbi:TPA: hypothetical protein JIU96_09965 [Acinetobacter baumannii]|jgi:hypothetical protein|uniref:Uncharacterized protein n=2 Tax=Acinetobacter TaxID=469 RepID=A0A1Y1P8T3_ACIBA|nr:hypothetical protein [Acinetobacter radioresistens]AMO42516.1 hypothetical protein A0J50_18480 [Acinetobacter sp. DUT-2]ASO73203.1 hypothetical protein Aba7804_21060 [Acinetobacter baumannii]ELW77839.1 hypothetical protein ACINWC743_A0284 [Acinetobacter sp. WC-743]EXB25075.1 hypothetical protein J518_4042 [Acinetobacter baumannii 1419130]EXH86572.1 hypothetical protein J606_3892 [Acinetobacter baumannii 318814]EZQ01184.1 hypothetical protein CL42_14975 [Acinetobacter sp. Ver3]KAB0622868.1